MERDIWMLKCAIEINKNHPAWPLTRISKEVRQRFLKEKGEAPSIETIRRRLTEMKKHRQKKRRKIVERSIPNS
jgi:hypothetical protein